MQVNKEGGDFMLRNRLTVASLLLALVLLSSQGASLAQFEQPPLTSTQDPFFRIVRFDAPSSATVGEMITFTARIQNEGRFPGTRNARLLIDGAIALLVPVTLAPGEGRELARPFVFTSDGPHIVVFTTDDDTARKTIAVQESPSTSPRGQVQLPQVQETQELALLHSLRDARTYPETLTVRLGVRVRLYATSLDGVHDPVVLSSDADGRNAAFALQIVRGPTSAGSLFSSSGKGFRLEPGTLTVIEFTPDRVGDYFITHRPHGHDIVGRLIVRN